MSLGVVVRCRPGHATYRCAVAGPLGELNDPAIDVGDVRPVGAVP